MMTEIERETKKKESRMGKRKARDEQGGGKGGEKTTEEK